MAKKKVEGELGRLVPVAFSIGHLAFDAFQLTVTTCLLAGDSVALKKGLLVGTRETL